MLDTQEQATKPVDYQNRDNLILKHNIEKSVVVIDKTIMQLTGFGVNNTNNLAQLKMLIKDLWDENQDIQAQLEAALGANEVNKLSIEELEEKLRIALVALHMARNEVAQLGMGGFSLSRIDNTISKIRGE